MSVHGNSRLRNSCRSAGETPTSSPWPAQSFGITGLPNGVYYIEVVANPEGVLHEISTRNDVSLRKVILGGTQVAGRCGYRPGITSTRKAENPRPAGPAAVPCLGASQDEPVVPVRGRTGGGGCHGRDDDLALAPAAHAASQSTVAPGRAHVAAGPRAAFRVGSVRLRKCGTNPLTFCGGLAVPLDYSSAASPRIHIGFRWLPVTRSLVLHDPGRRRRPRLCVDRQLSPSTSR